MSWFSRARQFLFPEEQTNEQTAADMKRQRSHPQEPSRSQQQQSGWTKSQSSKEREPSKPPHGARIVRHVIPPPEPVMVEAEALTPKMKAGIQGLQWYAHKQKQDVDGDIADEFLEEACKTSLLTPQRQVHPSPPLAVKQVEQGNVLLAKKARSYKQTIVLLATT